ncbi:MAG TPA: type II toxin-antitoxin system PemK/MazF family toxin, partial [Jatrophihabitantaceae bacterium]|nr:type II toxin-antitoxin system PemK/MazF family toxin [Jatrophihabitantaceae bacterium]
TRRMWPPLRGEVWDVDLPRVGAHPCVVLAVNALSARVSEVAVAMITSTPGPRSTRVPIGADAGLTRYDESYVDVMSVHTVPLDRFQRRRGRTSATELLAVETALRLVLGL